MACVEGRDRIKDETRFRSYLLGVAYHIYCKHLRERYRREGEELELISAFDVDPSPSSVVGRAQEQRLLLEGLRAIPVNCQVVLELHYWEELSTYEIAEILGIPPGTARSRLRRARDALEAAMSSLSRSKEVLESTLTRLDDWAALCGADIGSTAARAR
jgi:RNA polymerase sigma-70 factor (ECF subfamily)